MQLKKSAVYGHNHNKGKYGYGRKKETTTPKAVIISHNPSLLLNKRPFAAILPDSSNSFAAASIFGRKIIPPHSAALLNKLYHIHFALAISIKFFAALDM